MAADPTIAPLKRFTVDEYELLGKVGILAEDERWELLDGEIFAMSPIGPMHAGIVDRIMQLLVLATRGEYQVRVQNPMRLLPRSEPQPDILVAARRLDFYASAHPAAEDSRLIIEVADSTLAFDRGVKVPIYALAGVVEVWIVDAKAEVVHVHTDPEGRGYRTVRTLGIGEVLVPTAVDDVRIPVADIF